MFDVVFFVSQVILSLGDELEWRLLLCVLVCHGLVSVGHTSFFQPSLLPRFSFMLQWREPFKGRRASRIHGL